ncbi:hypothetical protein PTI98_009769 [Pleurotus ostreatus]|nr:hypothetical protein PTI98_009769 [Pleurotus ostreatus]
MEPVRPAAWRRPEKSTRTSHYTCFCRRSTDSPKDLQATSCIDDEQRFCATFTEHTLTPCLLEFTIPKGHTFRLRSVFRIQFRVMARLSWQHWNNETRYKKIQRMRHLNAEEHRNATVLPGRRRDD